MLTTQQALARMKTDIQLRGLSQGTLKVYTASAQAFLDFCDRPVEELHEVDVRRYLMNLINEKKLEPSTVNTHSAAIRFFFAVTLNRHMNYLQIPRMKQPKKLPVVLTRDEVGELISQASTLRHKALLLTAYGSGLRVSELVSLKTTDIESDSMRVLVRGAKGKKDHFTILSEKSLLTLRDYWLKYNPKNPDKYIFPGSGSSGHLRANAVSEAIEAALNRTGIQKKVTPHTLRHCFATHLLEDGCSLLQIKEMLGHASISSTVIYLHLANTTAGVKSPADSLPDRFVERPL
jgi:site-specific recombinase XerD